MSLLNLKRALWAEVALDAFRGEVGLDAFEATVGDLIADLGHLCDTKGVAFLEVVAKGVGDWKLEQRDPESLDPRPLVDIRISR